MDKKILIVLLLLLSSAVFAAYLRGNFSQAAQEGVRVVFGGAEPLSYQALVADTVPLLAQGLSGRDSLPPNTGMLFVFDPPRAESFWMHRMRFSIDIIWIRDGKVVGIDADAPLPSGLTTPTFASPGTVSYVFEVPAGTAARDGITIGREVSIVGYGDRR
jgi:uncharacterized membrane protein (UPF0127 family)